jgi:hypothetical protein
MQTMVAPSVHSQRYGAILESKAERAAAVVEVEAFAATFESVATASLSTAEEEIEVLQAYSKEVSRRLPEFTKSRAAVEASVKEEDSSERDGRGAGGTVGYSSRPPSSTTISSTGWTLPPLRSALGPRSSGMLEQRSDPHHRYQRPPPRATHTAKEGDRDKGGGEAKKSWSWGWRSESEDGEAGDDSRPIAWLVL